MVKVSLQEMNANQCDVPKIDEYMTVCVCAGPAGLSGHLLRAECEPLQPPALLPAPLQIPAHPHRRLPVGRPAALDPPGSALHRSGFTGCRLFFCLFIIFPGCYLSVFLFIPFFCTVFMHLMHCYRINNPPTCLC